MARLRIRYRAQPTHNVAMPRHWTTARVHSMRAALLLLLVAAGCSVDKPTPAACSKAPQIDTTSNVVVCACTCERNPADECPRGPDGRSRVPACWDDDASSSTSSADASSSSSTGAP